MVENDENIGFNDEYKEKLFKNFVNSLTWLEHGSDNYNKIKRAFDFAFDAHRGQRRKGGDREPYITHPVDVAKIASNEIGLRTTSVIAALLHDVVEDTDWKLEDISYVFGERIASIVEGLTKIENVYQTANQSIQAETFKKMILSIPHDERVIYLKICDRLHNMRTIDDMSASSKLIKAGENFYVYIPLAYQLGFYDIKNELEDLSFKYRHTEEYNKTLQLVDKHEQKLFDRINEVKSGINKELIQANLNHRIELIRKSLYSSWNRMNEKNISFDEIHNYFSIRIIFEPDNKLPIRDQCFQYFARITQAFELKSNSLRDWIKNPKKNGFSALVFEVMSQSGNWVEIQILTSRLDEIAHRGCSKLDDVNEGAETLKQRILEIRKDENAIEMIEDVKQSLYTTQIYVYTPKGKIIELPKGATLLDFAFHIHSELGLHCMSGEVNRKVVSRTHVLNSSDQVKIIASPSQKPDKDWINSVITPKAKAALRGFFNKQNKLKIVIGEDIYNKIIIELKLNKTDELMYQILSSMHYKSKEQLFIQLNNDDVKKELINIILKQKANPNFLQYIIKILQPKNDKNTIINITAPGLSPKEPLIIDHSFPYETFHCCNPIPGEDCIAYQDNFGNIAVHKRNCAEAKKLSAVHGKSTTEVIWKPSKSNSVRVGLRIRGNDRMGIMRDISNVISDQLNINMKSVNINSDDGIFEGEIILFVYNVDVLKDLISKLKKVNGISSVTRILKVEN